MRATLRTVGRSGRTLLIEAGLRIGLLPAELRTKRARCIVRSIALTTRARESSSGKDRNTPNGFKLAATNQIPKGVLDNPGISWMPRLNAAWDIGGKGDWVIRAGAGLFYNRVQGNYDYYSSGSDAQHLCGDS